MGEGGGIGVWYDKRRYGSNLVIGVLFSTPQHSFIIIAEQYDTGAILCRETLVLTEPLGLHIGGMGYEYYGASEKDKTALHEKIQELCRRYGEEY